MAISQNFPNTRPSLNLNFARSKKLDPRITFTRSSTATYVDEDGLIKSAATNTPRFEHDPTTGDCLGLLIEESRTNLLTYSGIPSANWSVNNSAVVTNNSAVSPDGTINATQIAGSAAIASGIFRTFSLTSGTVYTYSLFVKAVSGSNTIYFGTDIGTSATVQVNTSTGVAVSNSGGTVTNIISTSYPNNWYRISFTFTAATTGTHSFVIYNYTANANTWLAYGAQIEVGAFATSYIPTVASTVTRSADSASITGTNFSSWYNPDEGSVSAKFKFYANHGPYSEAVSIAAAGSGFMVIDIAGGLVTDCYSANTVVTGGNNARNTFVTGVRAYKFSTNDSVIGCSGASSITTQTGTKTNPNPTQLWLGRRGTGSTSFGSMNGHLQQVSYYPVRLSNSQLQTLTK